MEGGSRNWLPSLAAVAVLASLVVGVAGPTSGDAPANPIHHAPVLQSETDPASPLALVNKQHPLLPLDYVPADLVRPAVRMTSPGDEMLNATTAAAAEAMFTAAESDGVIITLVSGYRSFATQAQVRDGHIAALGLPAAEAVSAPPGHSEHQTGWAMDIGDGRGTCSITECFANQPAAIWAAANAHRFGFIVRYPPGAEQVTGYSYEPWHLRFVGVGPATDISARGVTLEEYHDATQ